MNCKYCGAELEKDARFCHICGQPVPIDRSEGGFCPHCDFRLPAVAVFCPHCGTKVSYSRLRESLPFEEPPLSAPGTGENAAAHVQESPKSAPAEKKAAPAKNEGAKTKKSDRSGRGGRLLALLIVILILGSLGAVLYVEAKTHGLGVGEYASTLLPVGETEKPARWSDLKAEQSAAPTAVAQEPALTEQELRTRQAYRLYRELLESRRDRIEAYNWQLENTESRPVVLCDVCGDELPELIWVEAAPTENVQAAALYVAAVRNGAAELIYSEQWDVQAGGGFCYYLFQLQGNKSLHSYAAWGEEKWTECFAVLSEQDGVLMRSEQLKSELTAVWDDSGAHEDKSFTQMGESVTEDLWRAAIEELNAQTASVLMRNRYASNFAKNWTEQKGCPAMTLRDALAFLSEGEAALS